MRISPPMRTAGALCAAFMAAGGLVACGGGSSTKTFSDKAMSITFTYPSDLNSGTVTTIAQHAGARGPAARKAVALNHNNLLLIEKYRVTIPTTKADLSELERASDEVISALFRRELNGTRTTFNGLPAVVYPPLHSVGDTSSQISYVFLDGAAYELDCQWTAQHESAMKKACREMKSTIKHRS